MISKYMVLKYGLSVFEDKKKFRAWLFSQNKAMDNRTPHALLKSSLGRQLVFDILGRIDFGIYS